MRDFDAANMRVLSTAKNVSAQFHGPLSDLSAGLWRRVGGVKQGGHMVCGQVLVWALEAMWLHGERLLASVLRGGGYRGGVDRSV